MAEMNVELLREKLHKAAIALVCIGEVCVDVSKQHISAERAIDKIRNYLHDTDAIGSRYRVDRLIAECIESQVYNIFEEKYDEWQKKYLGEWIGLEPQKIDYPSCCDGCSNNPKNGGSGICNCTLPYMQNPTTYTVPSGDSVMANSTCGYVYTTSTKLQDASTPTTNIIEAIERAKKYIKEE